jgi:hypothetical protein
MKGIEFDDSAAASGRQLGVRTALVIMVVRTENGVSNGAHGC